MMHDFCSIEACCRNENTLVDMAETNTCRLVNVDDVDILAPPILIMDSCVAVLVDQTRSILLGHSNHARSIRTTSEPQQ